jgi:hypothetical protein
MMPTAWPGVYALHPIFSSTAELGIGKDAENGLTLNDILR